MANSPSPRSPKRQQLPGQLPSVSTLVEPKEQEPSLETMYQGLDSPSESPPGPFALIERLGAVAEAARPILRRGRPSGPGGHSRCEHGRRTAHRQGCWVMVMVRLAGLMLEKTPATASSPVDLADLGIVEDEEDLEALETKPVPGRVAIRPGFHVVELVRLKKCFTTLRSSAGGLDSRRTR